VGAEDAKLLEAIEAKHNAHAAAVEVQRKGDGIPLVLDVQSSHRGFKRGSMKGRHRVHCS
jgi:hypothetical protein